MTALSQASIPTAFQRSAAQFGVAESDYLILSSLGIHSYESLALRVHPKDNLRDTVCLQAGYNDGHNDPEKGLITFNEFEMSDDASSLWKHGIYPKNSARRSWRKAGLPSTVAMETSAIDRGMPRPVSD